MTHAMAAELGLGGALNLNDATITGNRAVPGGGRLRSTWGAGTRPQFLVTFVAGTAAHG
jgi:hypothetical protein